MGLLVSWFFRIHTSLLVSWLQFNYICYVELDLFLDKVSFGTSRSNLGMYSKVIVVYSSYPEV